MTKAELFTQAFKPINKNAPMSVTSQKYMESSPINQLPVGTHCIVVPDLGTVTVTNNGIGNDKVIGLPEMPNGVTVDHEGYVIFEANDESNDVDATTLTNELNQVFEAIQTLQSTPSPSP
jgi:hypothetical protein